MKIITNSLNVTEEASQDLWHPRLDHMSEKGLTALFKKKLINVDKNATLGPCNHCLFGNQHRVSFNVSSMKRLEL